jgi:hypothetical protein
VSSKSASQTVIMTINDTSSMVLIYARNLGSKRGEFFRCCHITTCCYCRAHAKEQLLLYQTPKGFIGTLQFNYVISILPMLFSSQMKVKNASQKRHKDTHPTRWTEEEGGPAGCCRLPPVYSVSGGEVEKKDQPAIGDAIWPTGRIIRV